MTLIMKPTKTMILAALTAGSLLAWSPARAQDSSTNAPPANPPEHRMQGHGQNIDMLAKALDLTDDQKAKVQPIILAQRQKMREVFQDSSLSREDRMDKMKAIHEDTAAQLKTILTADQFEKWQKMSTPRGHHMPPPTSTGTNAPPSAP
jgi:periplasmic protein CpxP/Spy